MCLCFQLWVLANLAVLGRWDCFLNAHLLSAVLRRSKCSLGIWVFVNFSSLAFKAASVLLDL